MYFRKKYIENINDLQESYNNFKIKLKIFLCESGPSSQGSGGWEEGLSVSREGGGAEQILKLGVINCSRYMY